MKSFEDFFHNIGLLEYPFSSFTTENEIDKANKLFISPSIYSPIFQNFKQGNTIILSGDRGTGKTAILNDFFRYAIDENSIICSIEDYSTLRESYELVDMYKFLITQLSFSLFKDLSNKQKLISRLSKEDKILLSYLLKNYIPVISKRLLRDQIEKIQVSYISRILNKFLNISRPWLNYGATAGSIFIDEYLVKHFKSLPSTLEVSKIKEFFPELPLNVQDEFLNQDASFQLLINVVTICKKLGYCRILVLFDKVDEDPRLDNDAENISKFIENLLTDNKLLLNKDLQIVFSIWQTPLNFILDKVRTQKHYYARLSWNRNDLIRVLNQRLKTFSNNLISDFRAILNEDFSDGQIDLIFELANSNPRDLWHLFNKMFLVQHSIDSHANKISPDVLSSSIEAFIIEFNYYEYYPKKRNARANTMDFYSYVAHLLKLDDVIFTKNKLNAISGTGGSTTNYVIGMERIGLITRFSQEGGVVSYRINDPKVRYALLHRIPIERKY